jgi:hypothetical protein
MAIDLRFLTRLPDPQPHAVPCRNARYRSRTEQVRGSNPLTSTPQHSAGHPAGRRPSARPTPSRSPAGQQPRMIIGPVKAHPAQLGCRPEFPTRGGPAARLSRPRFGRGRRQGRPARQLRRPALPRRRRAGRYPVWRPPAPARCHGRRPGAGRRRRRCRRRPEELDQGAGHGRLLGPRPPDLGRAQPQIVGELRKEDGHPQRPLLVMVEPVAEPPTGQHAQQHRQMMDRLDARVGSLMAGDSALLPISTRRRSPNGTSWTMVRSNPRATASSSAARSSRGSGGDWSGTRGQAHANGVPSTT